MESTQVAVALDALVGVLTPGLPDVQVTDGQPLAIDVPDVLAIGFSPGRPAVDIVQEREGLSRGQRQETLDIACVLSRAVGDDDLSPVRQAVVALLDQIRDILAGDRRLGGAVLRAVLGYTGLLDQVNGPDGASVSVEFSILVTTAT